ncbi:hypothetical protein [Steroidobacter agaridevorans]|uniref:hypothetical protein n=1 Tax=Steroidobacter agaridevorans TaxID=2695856 RepID=UPI00137AD06B|nr:hypothetical protein [Steroidobacter agaridevorans]
MRIIDDRYMQHRRRLDLAWRLIQYEVRTRTISNWTQLAPHRIRALYRSYATQDHGAVKRRRGVSPYRLEIILDSTRLRLEAAIFAALCRSLDLLPTERVSQPERDLPNLDRGELLCDAYAWFRVEIPPAKITLEQGLLVLNELARGEQIELASCRSCGGVILSDRLSHGRSECAFCSRTERDQTESVAGKRTLSQKPRQHAQAGVGSS